MAVGVKVGADRPQGAIPARLRTAPYGRHTVAECGPWPTRREPVACPPIVGSAHP